MVNPMEENFRNHKILVHEYLQEDLVKDRLSKYKSISKIYKFDDFKKCSNKQPYYCHYLAWRLGRWKDEEWCKYFDGLLENAISLQGWNDARNKKSSIKDSSFEVFWQFLWELQVAKFFTDKGFKVEWLDKSSPDFKITSQSGIFYVECTNYTKSFGTLGFIKELCECVSERIQVLHIPFTPLSLGKTPEEKDILLDRIFDPIIELKKQSFIPKESRVLFSDDLVIRNFKIYLKDLFAEEPLEILGARMSGGNPSDTLQNAITEAIRMKIENDGLKNNLSNFHPHLVAINLLLSQDSETASYMQKSLGQEINLSPDIIEDWNKFDTMFLTHFGVDEILPKLCYIKDGSLEQPSLVSFQNGIQTITHEIHRQIQRAG